MWKFAIPTMALLAIGVNSGYAADMPVKVLPLRAPIFYGGSGAFCGAGAGGEATKVGNTAVVTTSATYEAGGLLNLGCGYVWAVGVDRWVAIKVNYAYANTGANAVGVAPAGVAVDSRQSGDLKISYGAPLSVLSGLFSNAAAGFPALPPVPSNVINNTAHPHIDIGVRLSRDTVGMGALLDEKKLHVKGLLGVGVVYQTNTNTTIDTFVDWTFGSGKFLLVPGAEVKVGSTFRFGVLMNYGVGG